MYASALFAPRLSIALMLKVDRACVGELGAWHHNSCVSIVINPNDCSRMSGFSRAIPALQMMWIKVEVQILGGTP